jgi:hypothetical protein
MGTALRKVFWFICFSGIVAYGAFLLLDGVVNADTKKEASTIVVRDVLDRNTHNLSGTVMVPSPCHQLIAYTQKMDPSNYLLAFDTWENPSRVCERVPVPRDFQLTLFAPPTGISLQGMFNDRTIPLRIIETPRR